MGILPSVEAASPPPGGGKAAAQIAPRVIARPPIAPQKAPATAKKAPVPVGKAPVPAGKAPVLAGKAPVLASKAPVLAGKAPVPVGKAPVLAGKAPVPAVKAPILAGKAPIPAGSAPLPQKGRLLAALPPPPAAALSPRTAPNPADPRETRITWLRQQVTELLRSPPLSRLRVGLEVMDADSGEVLLAHNAEAPFNPASNTKILTTAAAMKLLGSDWRYRTVLLAGAEERPATASLSGAPPPPQPGTLRGSVFLQGSGDPVLGTSGLGQLARNLRRIGVTRIEGDLLWDGQFRAIEQIEKAGAAQSAGGGALIFHRNAYTVHISPGEAGHPASAWLEPRSAFFQLDNKVQTVKGKRARLLVDHSRTRDGRLLVSVRGRIGALHGDARESRHLPDGGAFAAVALQQAMNDFGIELTGQVRIGPPPPGPLRIVGEVQTPLSEACRLSNKDSNNFVADTIFKTLGGERFGLPGTLQKGAKAVSEWLELLGISPSRVRIVNGSGLTHENRVRPDDLSQMLRRLYHDIQVAPEFLQSLAIGGIDGTIRYRFRGATVGLVRAKTGTLSGVSALSGYVGEKQGVLIFSILVEGFRQKRLDEVRHAQVLIVESLMRFLKKDEGKAAPPPAAPPAPEGGGGEDGERDSESDGDPT